MPMKPILGYLVSEATGIGGGGAAAEIGGCKQPNGLSRGGEDLLRGGGTFYGGGRGGQDRRM